MKIVTIPTEHFQSDDGTLHPTAAACELHDLAQLCCAFPFSTYYNVTPGRLARELQENKAAILAAFGVTT